jgi:hypothetical protein
MSAPLYPPSRPQSVGEVLDSGFRIFTVTLVRCLPYGLLSMLAGQLVNLFDIVTGQPLGEFGNGDPFWFVWYAAGAIIALGLWSAMMLRQSAIAAGRPTRMRAELREAFTRLPLVLASLIVWIVGTAIGLVLLVIPGIYLSVALPFAWPAVIVRRMGLGESIRYSLRLSRRNWWRTGAVFTVGFVVLFVFYAVGLVFALLIAPVVGAVDLAVVTAIATAVFASMGAFAGPFLCALMIATFGDLQVRAEGSDLERRIAATANG